MTPRQKTLKSLNTEQIKNMLIKAGYFADSSIPIKPEIIIADKIINSFNKEELSEFCSMYDDGRLDDIIGILFEIDNKNYPYKY